MKPQAYDELQLLQKRYPALACCREDIVNATELLIGCYRSGGKALTCGNGGSAADSEHVVGELMKAFALPRRLPAEDERAFQTLFPENGEYYREHLQQVLPAISLVSQTSLTSAYANDAAPDLAFAQQVYGYAQKGDVLLAFSTSGNSDNVIYAAEVAKMKGAKSIAFTGQQDCRLSRLADCTIQVPSSITCQIQEYHLPIYHSICLALEQEFFG